jgi:hypothetical protein
MRPVGLAKEVCLFHRLFLPVAVTLMLISVSGSNTNVNPLNAKLNPICHLLALLAAHHILYVSRIRVNKYIWQ